MQDVARVRQDIPKEASVGVVAGLFKRWGVVREVMRTYQSTLESVPRLLPGEAPSGRGGIHIPGQGGGTDKVVEKSLLALYKFAVTITLSLVCLRKLPALRTVTQTNREVTMETERHKQEDSRLTVDLHLSQCVWKVL